jgi:hypothetical protein
MANPPSAPVKRKFTGKHKKCGIAYYRKKSQTSAEHEAAVHDAPNVNHEVVAAAASVPKKLAQSNKASGHYNQH